MQFHLSEIALFQRLESKHRILLAGCGGGYDVYCALPLAIALWRRGHDVVLANLTFADAHVAGAESWTSELTRIDHRIQPASTYFPELHLSHWLAEHGFPSPVFCIDRTGAVGVRRAYELLIDRLQLEAIVVVDGGVDSLMRGDEAGLGTPHEDALTLAALDGLAVDRLLACIGFGVDAYHGVCHAHFLENVADLVRAGACLGTMSLVPQQPEAQAYVEAVRYATTQAPPYASIVNTSIAAAVQGFYGDHHSTERTHGSTLWINPLMAMFWIFDLQPVIDRLLYKAELRETQSLADVVRVIEHVRETLEGTRPWTDMTG
jgi:hypothetical protein